MDDSPAKAVPLSSSAAVASLGEEVLKLRLQAADAAPSPAPSKVATISAGLSSYGPPVALMVSLFGMTLLLGLYLLGPAQFVDLRKGMQSADPGEAARKMAAQLDAHETDDPALRAPRSSSQKESAVFEETKPRVDAASAQVVGVAATVNVKKVAVVGNAVPRLEQPKARLGAAKGEASAKVGHSPPEFAAKPAKGSERSDPIGHKIAALSADTAVADRSVSEASSAQKRAHGSRDDAFDPSQNPDAPGVPRPLGTTAPSRPLTN